MGIQGLNQQVESLAKYHAPAYFAGADLYVDGLNYAPRWVQHGKNSKFGPNGSVTMPQLMDQHISKLRNLKPRSITIVFDAMVSEEKFKIRIERSAQNLRRVKPSGSTADFFARRVLQAHKDIRVVYSGTEAEDEIMKLIDESPDRGDRLQFVFTNDSDVYRFYIHGAHKVEIVPLKLQKLKNRKPIKCINLGSALAANLVPEKSRVYPPVHRPGFSTINPPLPMRKVLEFINCGHIYHRFFISFGPFKLVDYPDVQALINPYDAGHEIRRIAYGVIIRKYFAARPDVDTSKIEEWRPERLRMVPVQVEPIQGEPLDLALTVFEKVPVASIIANQLEEVAAKYALTELEINCIWSMVVHFEIKSRWAPAHKVSEKSVILFALARAITKGITTLQDSIGRLFGVELLEASLSPHLIQAYLNKAGTEGLVDPPDARLRASFRKRASLFSGSSI